MSDHDPEVDAIRELLEGAGLIEVCVFADGKQAMRRTDDGEQVERQMAMSRDPDGVLEALLDAAGAPEAGTSRPYRRHRHRV